MHGSSTLAWHLFGLLLCAATPVGAMLWAIVHDWNRFGDQGHDIAKPDSGR